MTQMTPEVSKLMEQALSLSVEEQGRWRIPRFSTSVARWVKEYKRPGKPKIGKRIAELESGKAQTTSWAEVRRRNLAMLPPAHQSCEVS
jgi:hypothetical protein